MAHAENQDLCCVNLTWLQGSVIISVRTVLPMNPPVFLFRFYAFPLIIPLAFLLKLPDPDTLLQSNYNLYCILLFIMCFNGLSQRELKSIYRNMKMDFNTKWVACRCCLRFYLSCHFHSAALLHNLSALIITNLLLLKANKVNWINCPHRDNPEITLAVPASTWGTIKVK